MDNLNIHRNRKDDADCQNIYRWYKNEVCINKCATNVMRRGRKVEDDGIQMLGEIAIGDQSDGAYQCLGVLECDKIKIEEMKLKVMQDYYRRVMKVLESSLNRGNTVKAVAAVKYTAGILD